MIEDPKTHSLRPYDLDTLIAEIPELKKFGYTLEKIEFDPPLDSSNVKPAVWVKLVEIIEENYDRFDGFVILHGTDTMSFTASALSFMLENLTKPVILTGSQLPIGNIRTDGKENLISSVEIAAATIAGVPIIPEVCIYFENKLYRGNRTTKRNAEYFNAFYSANYPSLADTGVYIKYHYDQILVPKPGSKLKLHKSLNPNVAIIKIFPGMPNDIIRAVCNIEDLKAIVLESYGSGNAPTEEGFICEIRNAIASGIIVLNVTQCLQGSVDLGMYETSSELERLGVISGYDITTEAAVTKLMVLLGEGYSKEETVMFLNKSLAGEITTL